MRQHSKLLIDKTKAWQRLLDAVCQAAKVGERALGILAGGVYRNVGGNDRHLF
jgi:hypothetical protein